MDDFFIEYEYNRTVQLHRAANSQQPRSARVHVPVPVPDTREPRVENQFYFIFYLSIYFFFSSSLKLNLVNQPVCSSIKMLSLTCKWNFICKDDLRDRKNYFSPIIVRCTFFAELHYPRVPCKATIQQPNNDVTNFILCRLM